MNLRKTGILLAWAMIIAANGTAQKRTTHFPRHQVCSTRDERQCRILFAFHHPGI